MVDDEVRLAEALARGLRREGMAVEVAHDGPSGLRAARAGGFDAVVLDVMLPGLSGYDVVRTLRAEGDWVPVLMLSAKDGEHDEADGLDLGADDYLTKPFSFVVLVSRLRALVRRGAPARPAVLVAGDLVLDPAARTAARGEVPLELTSRELSLLEHLMRAGGQVVSKPELLERVFGGTEDGDPNVVEVYVGYLRRKVDEPFGRSSLVTVRGAGYRLDPDGG